MAPIILQVFTGGHDISVYFVNDSKLAEPGVLQRRKLYPACLPSILHKEKRGIFAGWQDPANIGEFYPENNALFLETVDSFRQQNLILRHIGVKNVTCRDPQWMNTNTFYPEGYSSNVGRYKDGPAIQVLLSL
jgi:hypothetical protein